MRLFLTLFIIFSGCTTGVKASKPVALANYLHLPPKAHGSAFKLAYKNKDYVVTAEHVCDTNPLILINGYLTRVLFVDKARDFCILDGTYVKGMKKLQASNVKISSGDPVEVVGFPLGHIYSPSRSVGKVIGLDFWTIMYPDGLRTIRVFTVNAPSFPGNSGGPVLRNGRVVGVLVAAEHATTFGAMIPIRSILKSMKENGL